MKGIPLFVHGADVLRPHSTSLIGHPICSIAVDASVYSAATCRRCQKRRSEQIGCSSARSFGSRIARWKSSHSEDTVLNFGGHEETSRPISALRADIPVVVCVRQKATCARIHEPNLSIGSNFELQP